MKTQIVPQNTLVESHKCHPMFKNTTGNHLQLLNPTLQFKNGIIKVSILYCDKEVDQYRDHGYHKIKISHDPEI